MFWCIELQADTGTSWKIDVLVGSKEEIARVSQPGKTILEALDETKRAIILKIKHALTSTNGYRRTYRSVDIYTAVLDEGITDVDQWHEWWAAREDTGT